MAIKDLKCAVDYCFENRRTNVYCSRHYTSWWRNGSAIYVDAKAFPTSPDPNIKFCTKCMEPKTIDMYHVRTRNGVDRVDGACKMCITKQAGDYREHREPSHVKDKRSRTAKLSIAKRLYGEGAVELKRQIIDGEAMCEICGSDQNLVIDHCHDSNELRGILCGNCNTALGLVHENVDKMTSMIKYIEAKRLKK